MIKELMHDPIFLAGKSEAATKEDMQVAQDLLDTLMAHRESRVDMAGNMIGVRKHIISFLDESGRAPTYTVMLNPEIIKKYGVYDTEEGCFSFLSEIRAGCSNLMAKESWHKVDLLRLQKNLLDTFLQNGALSQVQYDKSSGDLLNLLGMQRVK